MPNIYIFTEDTDGSLTLATALDGTVQSARRMIATDKAYTDATYRILEDTTGRKVIKETVASIRLDPPTTRGASDSEGE